ncbi:MAG: TIGR04255 family protein [Pyrinomonadaceae bacterium]
MQRFYKKPPLIEALCEIKFAGTEGDFTTWGNFYQKIKDSYPTKSELPSGIEFQITPNASSINPSEFIKRFTSSDNAQLIQATKDTFTLNRLSPYLGYEEFKKSFAEALKIYAETFFPKNFIQLAMRFVNQIVIPHKEFSLNDYLGLVPMIPEDMTDSLGNLTVQIQIAPQVENHFLQTTLRSAPSMPEGNSVFFLDIFDAFSGNSEYNADSIINIMDDAHKNIEFIFEKIIQEKSREVFQEEKENG